MRNLLIYEYVDAVARAGSIRKAAEFLSLTPSALNRRILSLEQELGAPLFERLGRGVRLSTAGELLVDLFRRQLAEVDRLKSQIADLSGLRRGSVAIACSQAALPYFLPQQISRYQVSHPGVTFQVLVRDGEAAGDALLDYSADLALVFEPLRLTDFQTILSVRQPIRAVMSKNHPLAGRDQLALEDCMDYPLILPSAPYAVRNLLEAAAGRLSLKLEPSVEAESYIFMKNFAALRQGISFELALGVPTAMIEPNLASIALELGPRHEGRLHLAQLRGRTLSVAAARFADQIAQALQSD